MSLVVYIYQWTAIEAKKKEKFKQEREKEKEKNKREIKPDKVMKQTADATEKKQKK